MMISRSRSATTSPRISIAGPWRTENERPTGGKTSGSSQAKQAYVRFEKSADEKKETEESLASLAASIEEMSATVSTLSSEIETLQADIHFADRRLLLSFRLDLA